MGLGGGVWRWGQLQGELRVISGVGGKAAGEVCHDPSGSSSSTIALLRCSVSPTVGKLLEIIPNAVQALDSGTACQHRRFLGSARMGICL